MSYLLALCEQFRLQRKISTLTAKQIRASHRKERMTKQIERVQKMYQKRHQKVQNMAQLMQKQFQVMVNNKYGLGTNGWNPGYGMMSGNTMTGCFQQIFQSLLASSKEKKNKDGVDITTHLESSDIQKMMQEMSSGTLSKVTDKDGTKYYGKDADISELKYNTFKAAYDGANQLYWQVQQGASTMVQEYQNSVSVWLQAAEAELDTQEDMEVMPLQEQELEWDLEQQSADTQLEDARARLDRMKQLVSDGTKNNAPSFGLG